MEKKIILTMQPSKDIDVVVNEHSGLTIGKDDRTVKADDIYNLLAYERGDTYIVESVNDQNLDAPVLQFFEELIKDITDRLNQLSQSDDIEEDDDDNNSAHYLSDDEELPF
jgi:hypothetical protein